MSQSGLSSREALLAMQSKYRELLRLRREQEDGIANDALRHAMRALAAASPGALREIDVLPIEALQARADDVEAALGGAEPARWLPWMISFHGWMRLALALRAAGHRADPVSATRWARQRERHPLDLPEQCVDEERVTALLRPEGGRLVPVALRAVAADFGVNADDVERALFPPVLRLGG